MPRWIVRPRINGARHPLVWQRLDFRRGDPWSVRCAYNPGYVLVTGAEGRVGFDDHKVLHPWFKAESPIKLRITISCDVLTYQHGQLAELEYRAAAQFHDVSGAANTLRPEDAVVK